MNKKTKIFIIIVIILLAGALVWFFLLQKKPVETGNETEAKNEFIGQEETFEIVEADNSENNIYTDLQYKFSFEYPKDFTVTKFQEGEYGETILVSRKAQDPSTGSGQDSFQIFISPFDESGPLTKERVLQDLPDMIIENAEQRVLKNGAVGLIFFSEEQSIGVTREIWFIYNDHLYQISTYKELDGLVANIISTWRFQ